MTLTNIASGQMLSSGIDFFGDGEFNTLGIEQFIHSDTGNVVNSGYEWNLKKYDDKSWINYFLYYNHIFL